MLGYKAFNNDWTCRKFQYEIGKTYRMDDIPKCCETGFHFCKKIIDCFTYYEFAPKTKFALVESRGAVVTNDNKKFATNVLKILKEISWEDVLKLINSGNGNIGYENSGNFNSGSWNTGDKNRGNRNSGDCNNGNDNTGRYNNGDCNTGNYNNGSRNTGHYNTGHYNTGEYNKGNCNAGDWNNGDWNSGCFNTGDGTFFMFNKPCSWTYLIWYRSSVRSVLNQCPENVNERQDWYDNLTENQKMIIKLLPNFDAKIFKQITGIDV